MKIWLDDVRPAPAGWVWTKTVNETLDLLATGGVSEVSLDFDLDHTDGSRKGIEVMQWLRDAQQHGYPIPVIHVHTANFWGGALMAQTWREIEADAEARRTRLRTRLLR